MKETYECVYCGYTTSDKLERKKHALACGKNLEIGNTPMPKNNELERLL